MINNPIEVIVEMPQGSKFKYEHDKENSVLYVDRLLSIPVPHNYGYVPYTLSPDGDPLDAFIVGDEPIYPLTKVYVYVLGVFKCTDNGEQDDKLVCAFPGSGAGTYVAIEELREYLSNYKPGFVVHSYEGYYEAIRILEESSQRYKNEKTTKS